MPQVNCFWIIALPAGWWYLASISICWSCSHGPSNNSSSSSPWSTDTSAGLLHLLLLYSFRKSQRMFVCNVMEDRQNINNFCYLCYIKILTHSNNVHPQIYLKRRVCGRWRGQSGGLPALWWQWSHSAGSLQRHPQECLCLLSDQRWLKAVGRVTRGLRSYVRAIFSPLPWAII